MGEVRPLEERDLPRLAEIHLSAIGHVGNTVEEVERGYIETVPELVLNRAYAEFASPSLVFEHDGIVQGFVLAGCQPAVFAGERVWVGSAGHLTVEPEARSSLAGIHLLRALCDGPQDLLYIDRSNTQGRMALKAAGFEQFPERSLRWSRVFSSAALQGQRVAQLFDLPWKPAMDGAARVGYWARRVARKPRFDLPDLPKATSVVALTPEHVLEVAPKAMTRFDLHPEFSDESQLTQSWDFMAKTRPNSTFVMHAVVNRRGTPVGWYIVDIDTHGFGDVVQMVGVVGQERLVLLHLLHEARRAGAVAVEGDLSLDMLFDVDDFDCEISAERTAKSVHSRDPKLVDAFRSGRAFLTQLEGEFLLWPPASVPR